MKADRKSAIPEDAKQKAGDRENQKDSKKNLPDLHGTRRNTRETEQGGEHGDDEEDKGIVQHKRILIYTLPTFALACVRQLSLVFSDSESHFSFSILYCAIFNSTSASAMAVV